MFICCVICKSKKGIVRSCLSPAFIPFILQASSPFETLIHTFCINFHTSVLTFIIFRFLQFLFTLSFFLFFVLSGIFLLGLKWGMLKYRGRYRYLPKDNKKKLMKKMCFFVDQENPKNTFMGVSRFENYFIGVGTKENREMLSRLEDFVKIHKATTLLLTSIQDITPHHNKHWRSRFSWTQKSAFEQEKPKRPSHVNTITFLFLSLSLSLSFACSDI